MATIASELQRIQIAKSDIKDTLESKGVVVDANKSVSNYFLYADSLGDYKKELPTIETTDPLTMVQIDENGGSVTLSYLGNVDIKSFQYKLNDGEWTNYTENTEISLVYGDKIQWRSQDGLSFSVGLDAYRYFIGKGKFILGGKIDSLNGDVPPTHDYNYAYCFSNFPVVETYVQFGIFISNYAYYKMYENCIILKKAEFTIDAVGQYSHYGMFYNCTGLEEAPIIITTTATFQYCFAFMFYNCISLTVAPPHLQAQTLSTGCYESMFEKCRLLEYPPVIGYLVYSMNVSCVLATDCCKSMFKNCSSLKETPYLYASSYVTGAYDYMFQNCSSLKNLYTFKTPSSASPADWLLGVGNSSWTDGILHRYNSNSFGSNPPSGFTTIQATKERQGMGFCIKPVGGSCTFTISKVGSASTKRYYYILFQPNPGNVVSTNGTSYTLGRTITVNSGYWCYLYNGDSSNITLTDTKYYNLSIDTSNCDYVELSGELFTLGNGSLVMNTPSSPLGATNFIGLFSGQDFTKIRFTDNLLKYRYLSDSCYMGMFSNCTGLTFGVNQKMKLPAKDVPNNAYMYMFRGSSITSLPEIQGKTFGSNACSSMFDSCRNITSLKDFKLPENPTLNSGAYSNMFYGCINLTTPMYEIPKCKFTSGSAGHFDSMFDGCSNLTKTPIIRQSSVTALATGYHSMFYDCTNLSSIKLLQALSSEGVDIFTIFTNVSSVGILETIPENLTTITVPEGWTKIEL